MFSHCLVSHVDFWVIATGVINTCLEVIRNHYFSYPTHKRPGANMPTCPVGKVLLPLRFHIGITGSTQNCHKDLDLLDFSRRWVDYRYGLPGIIHKHLFACFVVQTHGGFELSGPFPIQLAELAVAV